MTYAEFKDSIKKDISYIYRDNHTIDLRPITKNNNTVLDALIINSEDSNFSPTLYLNDFFEMISNGETYENVLCKVVDSYEKSKTDIPFDVSGILDYEKMKDKISFKLVNFDKNLDLLDDVPFFKYLDFAVLFYFHISDINGGSGSILITDEIMNSLGINYETLKEDAFKNTPRIHPYSSMSLSEVIASYLEDKTDFAPPESHKMFVLSNTEGVYGASVILYPGLLEKIAKNLGENFYLLPSSIHETIYLPESEIDDKDSLNRIICSVNETKVSSFEYLSDHYYYYDAKEKRLSY
ncbi:MAG: DUF5688 family protein [Eubacterium sp.]|nr:DUF5688 family protein [Eubacterium sp.]